MIEKPPSKSYAMVLGHVGRFGLSGKELGVFIALASHLSSQNPRTCWPHMSTVADLAECSVKTAEKAIARFKGLGWLVAEVIRDARGYVCGAAYTFSDSAPLRFPDPRDGGSGDPDPRDGGSGQPPDPQTGGSGLPPDPRNGTCLTRETGPARPANSRVQEETKEETKEEEPPGTSYPAEADASRGSAEPSALGAESVDEGITEGLFAADPTGGTPKAKSARKTTPKKPVDPATQLRQKQAHDLADRYYQAKNRMVKFLAVRGVIAKALENYPHEQVVAGVEHMATVDRDRPLTLDTLREGIERATGSHQPVNGRTNSHQPFRNNSPEAWDNDKGI